MLSLALEASVKRSGFIGAIFYHFSTPLALDFRCSKLGDHNKTFLLLARL
jgi:hypothetical protein